MKTLVILGGGTAGTMIANKLRHRLRGDEWAIKVVDRDDAHHYQPGYLFVPFGGYTSDEIVRSRHHFIHDGVELVYGEIEKNTAKDVLESARHPSIQFVTTSATDGEIVGKLTLHGQTKEVRGKRVGQTAEFSFDQRDFGIKPFSAMLGTLKDPRLRQPPFAPPFLKDGDHGVNS